MPSRNHARIFFAAVLIVSTVALASSALAAGSKSSDTMDSADWGEISPNDVTVISIPNSPGDEAALLAVNRTGDVLYWNSTLDTYNDVDPAPNGAYTVEYNGAIRLPASECDARTDCYVNVIERVNLSTGEVERLHSQTVPFFKSRTFYTSRWHDVDRINEHEFIVADIERDRVFIVNTTTDIVTWEWRASSNYETSSGGPFPYDWTHINDVEYLDDGTVMVSVRNQDEVIFIEREHGIIHSRTLGSDDEHTVLYEQHNPDYIAAENGGPAILVADSENGRIVEYQRNGENWVKSWVWMDDRIQWPRDADRLPNGHTLITDSHGNRVVEVDESGEVVWQFDVEVPYEAERLGTPDESGGGRSASELGLQPRQLDNGHSAGKKPVPVPLRVINWIKFLLPQKVVNATLFVLPSWVGVTESFAILTWVMAAVAWLGVETYMAGIRVQSPIRVQ